MLFILGLPLLFFTGLFFRHGPESVGAFLMLLLFLVGLLGHSLFRLLRQKAFPAFPPFPPSVAVLSLFLFLAAFSLRWIQLEDRSLWMDEDEQVGEILGYSLGSEGVSGLVKAAARTQQPPLDYFLEYASLKVFGVNERGARFPSLIFGSLSVVLFFWTLRVIFPLSLPLSLFGAVLMLFCPPLITYSQYARPYSSSLFFSILTLLATLLTIRCNRTLPSRFFFFSSQTLFLFSIGLQPPLYLVSLLLAAVFPLKKKLLAGLVFDTGLALLIFLPYQIFIIYHSTSYLNPPMVRSFLSSFDPAVYFSVFSTLLPGKGHAVFFLLFLFMALIKENGNEENQFIFLLFAFILLFPLIFTFVFRYFINWDLQERYYLTLIPVLLAALMGAVHLLSQRFRWRGVSLFYVFPLFTLLQFLFHLPAAYQKYSSCPEWKTIYRYFRENSSSADLSYFLNLEHVHHMPVNGFISHKIYYDDDQAKKSVPVTSVWDNSSRDIGVLLGRDLAGNKNPPYLFVFFGFFHGESGTFARTIGQFMEKAQKSQQFVLLRLEGRELLPVLTTDGLREGNFLVKLKNQEGLVITFQKFLESMEDLMGEQEQTYKIYQLLLVLNLWEKNLERARHYLGKLIRINPAGKLDRMIAQYHWILSRRAAP